MFIGDSFRHDVLKTAERASDRRKLARLQLDSECQLVVAAKVVPARLRDLTAAGCRVQSDAAPNLEAPTAILLPNGERYPVDVMVRNHGGHLGLKFKTEMDSKDFLKVVKALC